MKSFEQGFIEQQPINQRLLQTIRLIGEYKGKQELFKEQAPQVLETLRQAAVIQRSRWDRPNPKRWASRRVRLAAPLFPTVIRTVRQAAPYI